MPRVASTSSFPARASQSSTNGRTPPNPPLEFRCPHKGCSWSYNNRSDLARHVPRHLSLEEREKLMISCSFPGCTHKCLQRSNMRTHYTTKHTTDKPHVCHKCGYGTGDPACLTRHKRRCPKDAPRKRESAVRELKVIMDARSYLVVDAESSTNGSDSGASTPSSSSSTFSFSSLSPLPAASLPQTFEGHTPGFVPSPLGFDLDLDLDLSLTPLPEHSLLAPPTDASTCTWTPCAPFVPPSAGPSTRPATDTKLRWGGLYPSTYLPPSSYDPAYQYLWDIGFPQYDMPLYDFDPFSPAFVDPFLIPPFVGEFIETV
ncbi:hypothetical protein R3P38DRAFT_2844071 [Favolaschia claudopus]|uniref:C2H2-type domain-containing protein n=1 Tax=Favolaschia claudopus TaxID=2862362 RepID=A0AAW0E3L8_9AGAR